MTTTETLYSFIYADDLKAGDVYNDGQYEILDVTDDDGGIVAYVRFSDGGDGYRSWSHGQKAIGLTRPTKEK